MPVGFAADRVNALSRPLTRLTSYEPRMSREGVVPLTINPSGDFSFLPKEIEKERRRKREGRVGETRGPAVDGAPAARTISPRLLGDPR